MSRTAALPRRLKAIGPALVLAAVVVGPGSITLSTIAGGTYGYRLLWIPVAATVFMITYTWMGARIGVVTGDTLFEATRAKFGERTSRIAGIFGFCTIVAFQAGNNAGIGFASAALFGGEPRLWAGGFTIASAGFLWLPNLYEKVETLVKIVVGIMLVAFVGSLALVGVDFGRAASGLVPSFPDQSSLFLGLGLAATNFSIAAAAYQTHLMAEKDWDVDQLTEEGFDSIIGIAMLGLIVMVILLTSATVIYGTSNSAVSAQGMATQLRPVAGDGAFYLFLVGFFFASLSSLMVNALIGATLLVDGFGYDASMENQPVKLWTIVAMGIGLGVVVVVGDSPVELLRTAQALAIVAFPLLGYLLLSIARDKGVMGEYANGRAVDILGILGYLAIVGIVLNYLHEVVSFL